jgi:hypothetical protein
LEECGPCPIFAGFTLAFALQLRKRHGKPSVRVAEECQLFAEQQDKKIKEGEKGWTYNTHINIGEYTRTFSLKILSLDLDVDGRTIKMGF